MAKNKDISQMNKKELAKAIGNAKKLARKDLLMGGKAVNAKLKKWVESPALNKRAKNIAKKVEEYIENDLRPNMAKNAAEVAATKDWIHPSLKGKFESSVLKGLKGSTLNRGKVQELVIFIVAGQIKNFDATDNVDGFLAGDITTIIDYEKLGLDVNTELTNFGKHRFGIVEGQIKSGAGSSWGLYAKTTKSKQAKEKAEKREMLREHLLKTFKYSFEDDFFPEEVAKTLQDKLDIRIDNINTSDETQKLFAMLLDNSEWKGKITDKDAIKEQWKAQLENKEAIKAFFEMYVKLSAADYFLIGLPRDKGYGYMFSVPRSKMLTRFVEEHWSTFTASFNLKKQTLYYRYWPSAADYKQKLFNNLIGSNKLHVHSMTTYTKTDFFKDRKEYLTVTEIEQHRKFLKNEWANFIIPHLSFFDPEGAKYYQADYERIKRNY